MSDTSKKVEKVEIWSDDRDQYDSNGRPIVVDDQAIKDFFSTHPDFADNVMARVKTNYHSNINL